MRRILIGGLAALAALLPAVPAAAEAPAGAGLVAVGLGPGGLSLSVRGADGADRDPAGLVLTAEPGTVPDRADLAFLGEPGTPMWTVGAAEGAGFPSWDATAVPEGALAGDDVTLRIAAVDGPGTLRAYTLERPGLAEPRFTSGALTLDAGAELGGAVWAFDAPGEYAVTVAADAERRDGTPVTAEATYRVSAPATAAPARDTAVPGLRAAVAAAPETARKVFTEGHLDMGPRFAEGAWRVQIRDDSGASPQWRELSETVLKVADKAKITVPADPAYAFLGGGEVWVLPQAQQSGVVCPGWNTQDPGVVEKIGGDVTWELSKVDGPGAFALFLTGSFGKPEVLFDSARALPQSLPVPVNTHAHGNWAFTEPGVYQLTVAFSAKGKDGTAYSDTRVLNIAVGDATDTGTIGADEPGSSMPITGSPWFVPAVAAAAVALTGGAVLLVLARRRKR